MYILILNTNFLDICFCRDILRYLDRWIFPRMYKFVRLLDIHFHEDTLEFQNILVLLFLVFLFRVNSTNLQVKSSSNTSGIGIVPWIITSI